MMNANVKLLLPLCLTVFVSGAQATDEPVDDQGTTRDELVRMVGNALPEVIKEDNKELVDAMLKARLGKPLRETFDPQAAVRAVFGRQRPKLDPDCKRSFTQSGDLDPGECQASLGDPSGAGAYTEMRFSKHMSHGNFSYQKRIADRAWKFDDLKPVAMDDKAAYDKALQFLASTLGMDNMEIPTIPDDAKVMPVRNIALADLADGANTPRTLNVAKLVLLQRGMFVGLGGNYDWLPGPGKAVIVMDDAGVNQAAVKEWQELMLDPEISSENAKTKDQLVSDIVDGLRGFDKGPVKSISIHLILSSMPHKSFGLLLPAVQVIASTVPNDLSEEEQLALGNTQAGSAGIIQEIALVRFPGEMAAGDEERDN